MPTIVKLDIAPYEKDNSIQIAVFDGQIDETNLPEVKEKIDKVAADAGTKYLLFNFNKLLYINSKVIGYLASLYSTVTEQHKKIIIIEANPAILDILALVGLTTIISNHPKLEDALAEIQQDSKA